MFEVQPRTVYDDIRELKERCGLDIEFDRFKNGYYNKNPKKQLPTFELSDGELFAITLGNEMLSEYTGTSFEPILSSALEKIYERMPDRSEVDLGELRSMVNFNAGSVIKIKRRTFFDFNSACEKNLVMTLEYFTASRGEVTKREIEPYRLLESRGTWYVVAHCRMRNALRLFALHRMRDYFIKDEKFTPIDDGKIQEWIDSAFFLEHTEKESNIKIKFDPDASRYIRERKWHPSQELIEHQDGSCTLSFTAPSLDEIKRWVMSYGAQAEVLEPEELKLLMRVEFEAALQIYKKDGSY
ncbi:MAG: WYL domain-containing protein [Candidatus Melainabacteria bacterium]|nr:MAG: WYL domain-containing protein [Candidatus Melainabacteria bacterium]